MGRRPRGARLRREGDIVRQETFSSAKERARKDPVFYRMVSCFLDIFERMDMTPNDVHAAYMLARIEFERRHPIPLFDENWPKKGAPDR